MASWETCTHYFPRKAMFCDRPASFVVFGSHDEAPIATVGACDDHLAQMTKWQLDGTRVAQVEPIHKFREDWA